MSRGLPQFMRLCILPLSTFSIFFTFKGSLSLIFSPSLTLALQPLRHSFLLSSFPAQLSPRFPFISACNLFVSHILLTSLLIVFVESPLALPIQWRGCKSRISLTVKQSRKPVLLIFRHLRFLSF